MSRTDIPRAYRLEDLLIEPGQPAGVLGHHLRLEAAVAIPGHGHRDRADIGQHGLGGRAVTVVARATTGRVAFLVAQVLGELDIQGPIEHPLGQLSQQPVRAQQLGLVRVGPIQQLVSQLIDIQRVDPGVEILGHVHDPHWRGRAVSSAAPSDHEINSHNLPDTPSSTFTEAFDWIRFQPDGVVNAAGKPFCTNSSSRLFATMDDG
jgi:hypothetical protein